MLKAITTHQISILKILEEMSPDSSKSTLRSWLKNNRVKVNGTIIKNGNFIVPVGSQVVISRKTLNPNGLVKILYQDKQIVVIEKPEGVLSVATDFEKENTAFRYLKKHLSPLPIHVVHRLDQDTSGVMVFASSQEGLESLKNQFAEHTIKRKYVAIVEGHLSPKKGMWKSHLYEDRNYVVHVSNDPRKGKLAMTHYETVAQSKNYTMLSLTLETGKKNQIRVHCQAVGHSVVGDKKYGATTNPLKRLCLHAELLAFKHPTTKKEMRFQSSIPEGFYQLVPRGFKHEK